jgi:hypothetical protein
MDSFLTLLELGIIGCRDAGFSNQIARVATELRLCQAVISLATAPINVEIRLAAMIQDLQQAAAYSNDRVLSQRSVVYGGLVDSIRQNPGPVQWLTDEPLNQEIVESIVIGLERIGIAVKRLDPRRCEIEAEHIHNLPLTLDASHRKARRYYAESERYFFLDQLGVHAGAEEVCVARIAFERFWKAIDREGW